MKIKGKQMVAGGKHYRLNNKEKAIDDAEDMKEKKAGKTPSKAEEAREDKATGSKK